MTNIKILLFFFIVLLLVLAIGLWYYYLRESYSENYKLILYYTPWCHHCSELKPKWKKFMDENDGKFNNITLETINCDENNELADKYKINEIPSILLHNGESNVLYKGNREIEDIKKWVIEETKNL